MVKLACIDYTNDQQSFAHWALVTLVFPNSLSNNSPQTAPRADAVTIPNNTSAHALRSTSNPFSPLSQDSTLAFSVEWENVGPFLDGLQEIPEYTAPAEEPDGRMWVMRASRSKANGSQNALRNWMSNAWSEFVDLLKVWRKALVQLGFSNRTRTLNRSILSSWFLAIFQCI